jgi:hypothetical protein
LVIVGRGVRVGTGEVTVGLAEVGSTGSSVSAACGAEVLLGKTKGVSVARGMVEISVAEGVISPS